VPVATLRTWQERYHVVIPARSPGGHRLYSRDQVAQLRFLAGEVAAGLSSADAHRILAERLERGDPAQEVPMQGSVLVLLAERDPYAAELSEYFLLNEGYEVMLTLSAEQAMSQAAERAVDVAIVDLLISGAQGLRLCAQLHERGGTQVVAVSSFDAADAALQAGASAFLRKPIEPLQLVATVQDLAGRSAWTRSTQVRQP
jgi:CheY-like chemotaxis protein